jgi:hypothetical protein
MGLAKPIPNITNNAYRYTWNFVIPALLLQLVGFAQFWFPVGGERSNVDRGGVALVALLVGWLSTFPLPPSVFCIGCGGPLGWLALKSPRFTIGVLCSAGCERPCSTHHHLALVSHTALSPVPQTRTFIQKHATFWVGACVRATPATHTCRLHIHATRTIPCRLFAWFTRWSYCEHHSIASNLCTAISCAVPP